MSESNEHAPQLDAKVVLRIACGYLVSRALHVATELGIADHLRDGPKTIEDLAHATGANQDALYRLLRTLAAHGVFAELGAREFVTTPASAWLQSDALRDGLLMVGEVTGDGSWWQATGHLRHSVVTGSSAFDDLHGVGFFEYGRRNPKCGEWFARGMAKAAATENPVLARACDYSRFRQVVDVGGGQGGFLAEVLKLNQTVQGTLFDFPEIVQNPVYLEAQALAGRWAVVGGDFFESVPAGASAYVLKRILHDWSDDQALRILRRCREAMSAQSRLVIMDAVVPNGNTMDFSKVSDIMMMILGGRERSEEEFKALLQQAGFKLENVTLTPGVLTIVEASPA
jgi:hypothetical protein